MTITNGNVPAEFKCAFQVTKSIVFEVCYYTLGGNRQPHFSTMAGRLNRRKSDYAECGQCQGRLLSGEAKRFWQKWDGKHLGQLSYVERAAVWADIEALKERYNHIVIASDKFGTEDTRDIRFSEVVALSKEEPVRRPKGGWAPRLADGGDSLAEMHAAIAHA